jgi:hypothetical protein
MSNPVKNITISDAKTGFVIVERKFRWPTHANSSNLGSLTQSFYQFAREVDDGFIESVVFEGKEPTNSGGGKANKQHQTMKMVCCRNEFETISIYYDTTTYTVDPVDSNNLLLAVEEEFGRECGALLSQMGGRILALVDSVEQQEEEAGDIRAHFEFFVHHIDDIITTTFPRGASPPPIPPASFLEQRGGGGGHIRGGGGGSGGGVDDTSMGKRSDSSRSVRSRRSESSSRRTGSKRDQKL